MRGEDRLGYRAFQYRDALLWDGVVIGVEVLSDRPELNFWGVWHGILRRSFCERCYSCWISSQTRELGRFPEFQLGNSLGRTFHVVCARQMLIFLAFDVDSRSAVCVIEQLFLQLPGLVKKLEMLDLAQG